MFSGEVVESGNRPDYIFNPSNDGWFGVAGPPQRLAQARMRDKQVPDDCLECLRMGRDTHLVHDGNPHAGRRATRRVAAVASHDADDGGAHLSGVLERADQVGADAG